MKRFFYYLSLFLTGFLVSAQCALCPPDGGGGGGDGGGSGGGDGGGDGDPIGGGGVEVTVTLTGLTSTMTNAEYDYDLDVSGRVLSHDNTTYTVNGGVVVSSNSSGVRVKWTSIGSKYVEVRTRVNHTYYTNRLNVSVIGILQPGSVTASTTTTFCESTNPGTINGSSATGGDNSYSYRWLQKTGNPDTNYSGWAHAPGSNTGPSYNPPSISLKTTYVRKVTSAGQYKYSNPITYHKYTNSVAGTISSASNICGTQNVSFSLTGKNGTVKYWRKRYKNGNGSWSSWSTITSANTVSTSTQLSQWSGGTRTWEVQVNVQNGPCSSASTTKTITVNPTPVVPSTSISTNPTVCAGTSVIFSSSSGYDKWYTSPMGGSAFYTGNSFSQVVTSNTTFYVAGGSASCGQTATRVPVSVSVYGDVSGGTIHHPAVADPYTIPNPITATAGVAEGGFTYQWKKKAAGSGYFMNIDGAVNKDLSFDSPVQFDTQYKRVTTSNACGISVESNTVTLPIQKVGGTISGGATTCVGELVDYQISSTAPALGNANNTYRWEAKMEGQGWVTIQDSNTEEFNVFGSFATVLYDHGVIEFRRGVYDTDINGYIYSNSVAFTIHEVPGNIVDPGLVFTFQGMESTLNTSGITYYWQDEAGGMVETHASSIPVSNPNVYYLRPKSNEGCWGPAIEVNYSAYQPVDAVAERMSHDAILLSWNAGNGNEDAYVISKASSAEGPYDVLATIPATKTELLDKDLGMAETAYYKVQAVVGIQKSVATQTISATTSSTVVPINYIYQQPSYNGNISAIRWKGINDDHEQVYAFQYDGINRLAGSYYAQRGTGTYSLNNGRFSVPRITYDQNGNIERLIRQGVNSAGDAAIIDELVYDYGDIHARSNQLLRVSDAADSIGFYDGNTVGNDYAYDANGNMVKDLNKGIDTIYYNHLNLPTTVILSNSEGSQDSITYLYDAAGIKLSQAVYRGGTLEKKTDYIGEFIYETDTSGTRKLQLIQHEEGRIVPKSVSPSGGGQGEVFDYQYHLKDHLGNVRVTFSTTPENYQMKEDFEGGDNGFTDLHQHTDFNANTTQPHGSNDKVGLLQSGETGAMVFLSMNKGDTVDLSVKVNYETAPTGNSFLGTAYSALFSSFDGVYGSGTEGGVSSSSSTFDNALNGIDMSGKGNSSTAPRAFLNYIFFDRDMNYVTAGFLQISTAALRTAPHDYEQIAINDIIADQEGYILAYLSNENSEAVNIFFDDMEVYHGKTNIVESSDFYPGGAMFNRYERTASVPQNWKFQSKEWSPELRVYHYGPRDWDPYTWRTNAPDILADLFPDQSPYSLFRNNPVRYTDPTGMAPIDIVDGPCGNQPCPEGTQAVASVDGSLAGATPNIAVGTEGAQFRDDQKVISPVSNPVISSEQQASRVDPVEGEVSRPHNGIDIVQADDAQTAGTDVVAPQNGEVVFHRDGSDENGAGNRVRMKSNTGNDYRMFHLQEGSVPSNITEGAKVQRGQVIGKIGNTGRSTGAHLHMEVRNSSGVVQNPRSVIPALRNAPSKNVIRNVKVNFDNRRLNVITTSPFSN